MNRFELIEAMWVQAIAAWNDPIDPVYPQNIIHRLWLYLTGMLAILLGLDSIDWEVPTSLEELHLCTMTLVYWDAKYSAGPWGCHYGSSCILRPIAWWDIRIFSAGIST